MFTRTVNLHEPTISVNASLGIPVILMITGDHSKQDSKYTKHVIFTYFYSAIYSPI